MTTLSILGNLFLSEGKPGPVLEVRCKKRIGEDNFVGCMRKALEDAYPEVRCKKYFIFVTWMLYRASLTSVLVGPLSAAAASSRYT